MLPPFIIEQLRKREEEERRRDERPQLELPLHHGNAPKKRRKTDESGNRGIVEIRIWG